jgi:hypothetical protein
MSDKLVLRFLGLLETTQYTLEQSHGVPPVSVACDNTTLMEEDACGYSSVKTVRSIDNDIERLIHKGTVMVSDMEYDDAAA